MDKFRNIEELKKEFSNISILEDYESQERYSIETDKSEKIELPSSNVIKVYLSDQSWFAVRPSGTELKLKIYYSAPGKTHYAADRKTNQMKECVEHFLVEKK